jgi:hypothetical protein
MNNKYAEIIGCSKEIIDHINKQILSRKELALLNPQGESNFRKPIASSNPRLVKYAEQARKTSFTPIPPEFFGGRSTSRSKSELQKSSRPEYHKPIRMIPGILDLMESRIFSSGGSSHERLESSPFVQREKTAQEIEWLKAANYFKMPKSENNPQKAIMDGKKRKSIKNIFKRGSLINGAVRDQLIERIVYL